MSKTTIEWCVRPGTHPETWNPVTGCTKVSQGCKNCYAETMHKRLRAMGQEKYQNNFLAGAREQPSALSIPFKWKKPRTVFVNSMSDLFHYSIGTEFLNKVFAVMMMSPQHTFIILTKRPERMKEYFKNEFFRNVSTEILPNVWLGVSVEDQAAADERIPLLFHVPAAVRFISCEPLLGQVDLTDYLFNQYYTEPYNPTDPIINIDWVIAGGESGKNARPMHPDWVRQLRDQCISAEVPFFFKQWGEWVDFNQTDKLGIAYRWTDIGASLKVGKKAAGRLLDGIEYTDFPYTAPKVGDYTELYDSKNPQPEPE